MCIEILINSPLLLNHSRSGKRPRDQTGGLLHCRQILYHLSYQGSPNLLGSSIHGILQARILVGSHSLLQGIFPTQGSKPGLLHYKQILYQLNHEGSPLLNHT